MRVKDIQLGDYLVFDPTNKNNQLEVGINVVQVHKIEKKFLRYHVYTFAIDNDSGNPNTTTGLDFKSDLRGEVPMLEKLIPKNSVIRAASSILLQQGKRTKGKMSTRWICLQHSQL